MSLADDYPDAELIALCDRHIVNMAAYDADRTPEGRLVAAAQAMNDDKLLAWVMAAPMGSAP